MSIIAIRFHATKRMKKVMPVACAIVVDSERRDLLMPVSETQRDILELEKKSQLFLSFFILVVLCRTAWAVSSVGRAVGF